MKPISSDLFTQYSQALTKIAELEEKIKKLEALLNANKAKP